MQRRIKNGEKEMKLTNRTTPQALNYQCDVCGAIKCHKDMYDDKICYDCYDKREIEVEVKKK